MSSFHSRPYQLKGHCCFATPGRLTGEGCSIDSDIAELEEWVPSGTSTEKRTPTGTENQETDSSPRVSKAKTCAGPLVITDTEEKIKSLMLLTGEDGLFSGPWKNDQDAEKEYVDDPYYQLGQILSGGWFRLKLSGPLAETRDAAREFGSE